MALKPLGDGFIALVKMLISPIIFCTVVLGIAGAGDMKKVGRVGGKALLYFEVVSTFALVIGLIVANVIQPGAGFNVDPATLDGRGGGRLRQDRGQPVAPSSSCCTSSRAPSSTPSPGRAICCRCCSSPCSSATR